MPVQRTLRVPAERKRLPFCSFLGFASLHKRFFSFFKSLLDSNYTTTSFLVDISLDETQASLFS